MLNLNRFRIKTRINAGFGALIAIALGMAAFGGWELTRIGGGEQLSAAVDRLMEAAKASTNLALVTRVGAIESAILLGRVANWRFLATTDPKGPATFNASVQRAEAVIEQFENTVSAEPLAGQLSAVKTALKDYAARF